MRTFDHSTPLAGLTVGQFEPWIANIFAREAEKARQADVDGSRALSLIAAAKVAKRRQADVRAALLAGSLKGQNRGGRWFVPAAEVRAWIAAGYPVKP